MRLSLRWFPPAALALALVAAAAPSRAAGTITTTGATIETGFAPAKGTLTVQPSAPPVTPPSLPSVDPLGPIGTMTGGIPAFTAAGGGTAFVVGANTTLPGGIYNYSTYNVTPGMSITYTSAVTIQTGGDVQIDGLVTSTAPGCAVTFVCGGNFRVISHTGPVTTGIITTGLGSPISIDANGTITTTSADTSTAAIDAASGPVSLLAHAAGSPLTLGSITVRSRSAGNLLVQSAGSVAIPAGTVRADIGDVTVQAFGGDAALQTATLQSNNNLLVEASGRVSATAGSALAGVNTATVSAFGGDVVVSGGSSVSQTGGTGNVAVAASGGVFVSGASSILNMGTGDLGATAYGGVLYLETAGSAAGSTVRNFGARGVSLRASIAVLVAGTSQVTSDGGNVTLRANGGSVVLMGDPSVNAPLGSIDARGESSFQALADAMVSTTALPALNAQAMLLRGGSGGISLAADPVVASAGALSLVAGSNIFVNSDLTANGTLSIISTQGNVDVSGRRLTTGSTGARTGDVLVECYGGSTATIDATNATVRSGDDVAASGDVTLKVYAPAVVAERGTLVPRQVKVRLRKRDLTRSRLTANGVLDTGPDAVDLAGDATVTVGRLTFPVTLAADAAGRPSFSGGGVTIKLTPSKVGSSKTAFTLNVTGDFRGMLDASATGQMDLAFQLGTLDARGTVRLVDGTFVRSRRRAALVLPTLFVVSARATIKGGGKDRLDLVTGFATDGTTPNQAPDVTVTFGNSYSATLPAGSFRALGGGRFAASDVSQGVTSLVVDYRSETVSFHARGVTLGTLAPGLVVQARATVTLGNDARGADIRVAHRGTSLIY